MLLPVKVQFITFRVPGQVCALNLATNHTRKRYAQLPKYLDWYFDYKMQHGIITNETF